MRKTPKVIREVDSDVFERVFVDTNIHVSISYRLLPKQVTTCYADGLSVIRFLRNAISSAIRRCNPIPSSDAFRRVLMQRLLRDTAVH